MSVFSKRQGIQVAATRALNDRADCEDKFEHCSLAQNYQFFKRRGMHLAYQSNARQIAKVPHPGAYLHWTHGVAQIPAAGRRVEKKSDVGMHLDTLERLMAITNALIDEHVLIVKAEEERGEEARLASQTLDTMIALQASHMVQREQLLRELFMATI